MKIKLTHSIKIDDGHSEPFTAFIRGKNIDKPNGESISGKIEFIYIPKSITVEKCELIYDTDEG